MPDSTRTPGPGFKPSDAPVPPYVTQKATEAYQAGYARGWDDGSIKFLEMERDGSEKTPANSQRLDKKPVYIAPDVPTWNEIPSVSHEYQNIGESLYKWGYVDGWGASVMAYIRDRQAR
jgi:hypothetical protein